MANQKEEELINEDKIVNQLRCLGIDMIDSNPFSDTWKNLLNNPEKVSAVNAICETGKVIKMYFKKY